MKARKQTPLTRAAEMMKDALASVRNDIKRAKECQALIENNRIGVQLLAAVLFERTKGIDSYAYVGTYSGKPRIYFTLNQVSGFTDDRVMDTLDFLTREFQDMSSYESAEYLYRTYTFKRDDMVVEMQVSVRSDSETCQRVEIGEEVVVQKKYKVVCNGAE